MIWAIYIILLGLIGPAEARTALSQPTTFYVAPANCNISVGYWPDTNTPITACGNDWLGQGTQASPFATPQHVHILLMTQYDLACQPVTIQLAAARAPSQYVYPKGYNASGRAPGECGSAPSLYFNPTFNYVIGDQAPITLQGDVNNIPGVLIQPIAGAGGGVTLSEGASLRLYGVSIDTSLSGQDCIDVFWNSLLDAGWIAFGQAGGGASGGQLHWGIAFNSAVLMEGPEIINGSAWAHLEVGQFSIFYYNNNGSVGHPIQVTINNGPTFPAGYFYIDQSQVWSVGVNYSGIAHGPKWRIIRQGLLETGGGQATAAVPYACNQNLTPGDSGGMGGNGNGICD